MTTIQRTFAALAACVALAATAIAPTMAAAAGEHDMSGLAAVYSDKLHGRTTASGKRYDRNAMTAAHQTLPFGTRVRVTNQKNKRSTVVRINDRGPTQAGRVIDMSPRSAKAIGIPGWGSAPVKLSVVRK